MRFLFDYFPIICFFVAYKFYGIYVATAVAMGASITQVSVYWLKHRRFERFHVITLLFVLILGSATLLFHNPIFIKWKPSIIYWAFALSLFISQYASNKTLVQKMLGDKVKLPASVWRRINLAWAIFFSCLGLLNLYVVYNFTTDAWVNFKLFGTLGLMVVFIVLQALYMARYMEDPQGKEV